MVTKAQLDQMESDLDRATTYEEKQQRLGAFRAAVREFVAANTKPTYTRDQLRAMSSAEFTANRADILAAVREGRIEGVEPPVTPAQQVERDNLKATRADIRSRMPNLTYKSEETE